MDSIELVGEGDEVEIEELLGRLSIEAEDKAAESTSRS